MSESVSNETLPKRKLFGGNGNRKTQSFGSIKRACLDSGQLFEDPEFPADHSSIYLKESEEDEKFKWMRPTELVSHPKFFVSGASRFDVKQGELADCWLLAAVANLTQDEKLFSHVVLSEHNSFGRDYCGAFLFRFWRYGAWVDVVVDDRLPTRDGELVFMRSEAKNEFWSALLEKAYAKLHRSYMALEYGFVIDALQDFTGGITELYEKKSEPENLLKIIESAFTRSSLMGCSFKEQTDGLITGHAYSITSVKMVDVLDMDAPELHQKIPLLRIRNPWGSSEWVGDWSDSSDKWKLIPAEVKKDLGLSCENDGEFWMSYDEFSKLWAAVEICHLSAGKFSADDCVDGKDPSIGWVESRYEGSWIPGATAGGSSKDSETFASNPQYILKLDSHDKNDPNKKSTLLISLIQKNRRAQRKLGVKSLSIGFAIYALRDAANVAKPLPTQFFKDNEAVGSSTFMDLRELSSRFILDPGSYLIVPSTLEPNEEGEFMLRVFTECAADLSQYDGNVGVTDVDARVKETAKNEDDQKKWVGELFKTVAGEDGEIDWRELKEILNTAMRSESGEEGLPNHVCRSMVALMDGDITGRLGLEETVKLFKFVRVWKAAFKLYDEDESSYLNTFELRKALGSAGYEVNNKILEGITLRYGDLEGKIHFDDFLLCGIKLMAMQETFHKRSKDDGKSATFSLEEWMQTTIYS